MSFIDKFKGPKAQADSSAAQDTASFEPITEEMLAQKAKEAQAARQKDASKPRRPRLEIIGGFKDPLRRPRFILWSAVGILVLAVVMILALGVTSSYWFCANGCHKVQDDSIMAYNRSSHSEISCMACHMPVGADPVTFIIHKAEALGELYLTVTGDYELPLNASSHVALTMDSSQCTQCHDMEKRTVTPSEGVLIDHAAHAEKGVGCTLCHNRIAHVEDFEPVGIDPATGKKVTEKHEVFNSMTACFRCHTQDEPRTAAELKAPGNCDACHPKGFELKPKSHFEAGFYPKGHAKLGAAAAEKVEKAKAEAELKEIEEKRAGSEEHAAVFIEEAAASSGGGHSVGESLIDVALINECSTCHSEKFCSDCHGLPMPHPKDFSEDHGAVGEKNPQVCATCHGPADRFCDGCHHGTALNRTYDFNLVWLSQHDAVAGETGAAACFSCHKATYCAHCHVTGSTD